ncbi:MAG: hypothetical protein JRN44_01130 [Nitrososphaerota archaeon]|jgi:hypothetical protein|nr:hypothetical protein [Nitrososphaerota archaeon]MDG6941717.1 hypothetical protein [Nitrososphaerota archaeon]MDG6947109.1 hypothetical protein [Nitrososphaerota archaeon]MDG6951341.1 hypothetical protein [Nitrososphaerota archaeon]
MEKELPTEKPSTEVESIAKELPSIDQVEGTEESTEETRPRRGRPPKDIETIKRVPITVSLSPKLISEIADRADEQDISRSELVNNAIAFDFKVHDRAGKEAYFLFTTEEEFKKFVDWTLDEYDKRLAKRLEKDEEKTTQKAREKADSVKETDSESEKQEEDEGVGILGIHF